MTSKTNPSVHMGTISGGQAREIYAENPVILLPMGSHEDQGPHAPMGDYLLAEKIASTLAGQGLFSAQSASQASQVQSPRP